MKPAASAVTVRAATNPALLAVKRKADRPWLRHAATPWAILAVCLALTVTAWRVMDHSVHQRAQDRFAFQIADVKESIANRMLNYETVLRGGVGLFDASDSVERSEWQAYVKSLQVERYFPGIQGVGFSQVVSPDERAQHERQIRAQGFPDYRIVPPDVRDAITAIVYLEPFDTRNRRAFGYDMFTEATRRAAMERARDSGLPALSGRVTLVQEAATDVQHGVLMFLPVYRHGQPHDSVEQRRAALQGFVYAPFRIDDLMQGILGAERRDIEFELYDGLQISTQTVLYRGHPGELHATDSSVLSEFENLSQIEVAGRSWSLFLHAPPGFIGLAEKSQSWLVAIAGTLLSLLLFFIVDSLARRQKNAEALAREMTADLQRSNADLEQFAYAASHDLRQPLRMVASYLQLLEMELEPVLKAETRQNLHFAIEGAQRMDQMLKALLDYSRVGRNNEAMTLLESRPLLDEALHFLQPAIDEAQAELSIEGTWPRLFGQRDELVRLLQNLIGNALKYRIDGRPPQIVVSAQPGEVGKEGKIEGSQREGREHRFSVLDNGVGLIAGQETRLFKVFERLHPRSKYPGTGIGLALCRKIVEHHGGRIWVESAGENQGCCFIFTLPLAAEASVAQSSGAKL
jgi:signal transduction histidine kinase